MSERDLLSIEKEMLGIYISGHPLEKLREQIEKQVSISTIQIKEIDEQNSSMQYDDIEMNLQKPRFSDGDHVKYIGIITSIKKKYTKNNKIMAFVTIEDLYGQAEIIVFENAYMKAGASLTEENIVLIEGRLSIREDDSTKIIANDIKDFGEQKHKVLILNITDVNEKEKAKLRGAIKYFNGDKNNIPVFVKVNDENKSCGQIYVTEEILDIFRGIIGEENVLIKEE